MFNEARIEKLLDYVQGNALPAIIVLVVGFILIKIILKAVNKSLEKSKKIDAMLRRFIKSAISIALWVVVLLAVLKQLGVDATSVITIFAAAGAAIALALQGSLSNLASGILIIFTQPFSHGDYIQGSGFEGTVDSIDLLYTTIITADGKTVSIPNSNLTSNSITNYDKQGIRRIDVCVGVSYESDIEKVKSVLLQISKDSGYYVDDKPVCADIIEYADSSINMRLRGWVKSSDYWNAMWYVHNEIKPKFDQNDIEIPYPQLDLHKK